jgi:hypothetical protein
MRLTDGFPALASELEMALRAIGEQSLADQIPTIEVCGRCECGQRNCGTFYTKPTAEWEGQRLRQVIPQVNRLIALDVCGNDIVCVEFLDRRDVIAFLDKHLGQVDAG